MILEFHSNSSLTERVVLAIAGAGLTILLLWIFAGDEKAKSFFLTRTFATCAILYPNSAEIRKNRLPIGAEAILLHS